MGPDFYAILGIAPSSDATAIRAAYKALMFRFHPDRNPSAEAGARARAINEAFKTLGDPRQRAAYDTRRAAERAANDARRAAAERAVQEAHRAAAKRAAKPSRPATPPPNPGHAAPMRVRPAPRTLAHLKLPEWVTGARVAAVGGTLSLALAVHLATVAFAPAGLFVSATSARAGTGDTRTIGMTRMPPPEITFDDVEQGAAAFASAFENGQMRGARIASQQCHRDVAESPDWSTADRCAAFDLAANAYDDAVSQSGGRGSDPYFLFVGRNPVALYRTLSSDERALAMRTTRIMQGALPALQQAMWPDAHRTAAPARGRDTIDTP